MMKFLKGHREVFFDIEIEMGGALTEEYIQSAPKPVTSIAWYDKTPLMNGLSLF